LDRHTKYGFNTVFFARRATRQSKAKKNWAVILWAYSEGSGAKLEGVRLTLKRAFISKKCQSTTLCFARLMQF